MTKYFLFFTKSHTFVLNDQVFSDLSTDVTLTMWTLLKTCQWEQKNKTNTLNISKIFSFINKYILALICFQRMNFPEQYPPKVKLQMRNVMRNTFQAKYINISMFIEDLRWYHTLQVKFDLLA